MGMLEFNEDGTLKVPEHIRRDKEKFDKKIRTIKSNPKKVYVDYEEIESGYEDEWTITLPSNIPKGILLELKRWADKKHEIVGGSAWVEEESENRFILKIKGRENRYRWAHTFLNGLNTALMKDFNTMIKHKNTDKYNFHVDHTYSV